MPPAVLTKELCAYLNRPVDDPGPTPGLPYLTDEEYRASIQAALADAPDQSSIWIFAYGSLIWKPAFEYTEQRVGALSGWHRSFCLKTTRWRGSPARPGLMMALEQGGQCSGVVYKLASDRLDNGLNTLWRRELGVKPVNHDVRWVRVSTDQGEISALTFTASRHGQSYVGDISPEIAADIISEAVGVWGSCAEYLYETGRHLEAAGIHDAGLAYLEARVAEKIATKYAHPPSES